MTGNGISPTTHRAGCWRYHQRCAVSRVDSLAAALREALAEFRTAAVADGGDVFTARVPAGLLDEWHRALEAADETPPGVAGDVSTTRHVEHPQPPAGP